MDIKAWEVCGIANNLWSKERLTPRKILGRSPIYDDDEAEERQTVIPGTPEWERWVKQKFPKKLWAELLKGKTNGSDRRTDRKDGGR